jgi:double-strand break repair protein AddB
MRLRQAVENGQSAALITPDRMITRQVTAALDTWNIIPDDSAGRPLQLSATGRFLRHVSALFTHRLTSEALMTLLKHPLTHSGESRGTHLLLARELELSLRRHGPPFPTADSLHLWASKREKRDTDDWVEWVITCFLAQDKTGEAPLEQLVSQHIALADQIAQGSIGAGSGALWEETPGRKARQVVDELTSEATHGGPIDPVDYHDLFNSILSKAEVRDPDAPHPLIRIWGTLEARVQGADLLILAGLNEASWPSAPTPDPWLNRKMRLDAGLLLPERRIGLSAHDFQQAIAADEVWLTRSIRSDDAETVPSRWLNRLLNLLGGLPENGGLIAREQMRERGHHWLALARALETVTSTDAAPRPAPCPPATARPKKLSVTEIKHLVRDPYAIYAKHILNLRPLNPLMQVPDALLRGTVLHEVVEQFIKGIRDDTTDLTADNLLKIATEILDENVPWSDARVMWLARMARIADWFIETEQQRQQNAHPREFEVKGETVLPDLGFTLVAKADRIDRDFNGHLHIYDYKTGALPTKKQQKLFDKQLLLMAAISEQSGFENLGPAKVAKASYIGIGTSPSVAEAPLEDQTIGDIWGEFHKLISAYLDPTQPFVPRRMMHSKDDISDYDQMSRYGEWDTTDTPNREDLA